MSPYHFFLKNAGYSYDPATQTRMQGRIQSARALARAEAAASKAGYSFEWEIDREINSSDFSDKNPPWDLWTCVMHAPSGLIEASLCGIDLGRDRTPWESPYRRVVEAELASERCR